MTDESPDAPALLQRSLADEMSAVLGPGGLIARNMPSFQVRDAQIKMARIVARAIEEDCNAVVEAGTGTGKSLALLIPAIYSGKRVIISTMNKALQNQIVRTDIPFLQKVLPLTFTAAVIKGRTNYLCQDRLDLEGRVPREGEDAVMFRAIQAWADTTPSGDLDDLPVLPSRALLNRIGSTQHTCIDTACQFHDECFYEGAKEELQDAQIIVCNHALLLADLQLRMINPIGGILPDRDAVIIDEAHELEEAARGAFTTTLRRSDMAALVNSATLKRYASAVALEAVRQAAGSFFRDMEGRAGEIMGDLPLGARVADALDELGDELAGSNPFTGEKASRSSRIYSRLGDWIDKIGDDAARLAEEGKKGRVRFVETVRDGKGVVTDVIVKGAPLSVGGILANALFKATPVICASATLAVATGSTKKKVDADGRPKTPFQYFRFAVGMDLPYRGEERNDDETPPRRVLEMQAPSPFDFTRRAQLYVPAHLPPFEGVLTPSYTAALADEMEALVSLSNGRTFLLFTSYAALDAVHAILAPRLATRYTVLHQKEASQPELVRRFKADGKAVLFASKTYWTGIDISGNALTMVVMDRVPFSHPEDSVLAARVNKMKAEKRDWFNELMLPTAVITLKQGFGRLLRADTDWGGVAILDTRLTTKTYGKRVIQSLPPARVESNRARVAAFMAPFQAQERVG